MVFDLISISLFFTFHMISCFFLYQGLSRKEYEAKKEQIADEIITRLEKKLFPGLKSSIDFMEVYLRF